jgi:glycosyltransferase involved in cell wall biosynthesis
MRIVTNTLSLAPGTGIDTYALQMATALSRRDHHVTVLAQRDGALRGEWEAHCAEVGICGDFLHAPVTVAGLRRPAPLARWAATAARAARLARAARPDVVFANDAQALAWAVAAAAGRPTAVVCHLHNQLGAQPLGRQRRHLARRVDRFITPSRFLRDHWVAKGLPAGQVQVIAQAVDADRFPLVTGERRARARAALAIGDDAFVAVFVGRVVEDKGVDVLIEAWNRLGLGPDEGRLVLVGPIWPPDYEARLARTAPPGRCLFIRPQTDVTALLHAADVVVLPSLWPEAGPRVLLEAMATGAAVITSSGGGAPEMVPGVLDGFVIPAGSVDALVDALRRARELRTSVPGLAEVLRAHVVDHHHIDRAARRLEETFAEALRDRRPEGRPA